jgi:hypothetical protein
MDRSEAIPPAIIAVKSPCTAQVAEPGPNSVIARRPGQVEFATADDVADLVGNLAADGSMAG